MLCKNPYVLSNSSFGCGQCLPCRLNRRRLWTHRLLLESFFHEASSFVTLTYSDESLPEGGTLAPGDVQLWLKRLRKALYPKKIRYYLVGEYGDESWRPHYHVALYGHGGCLWFPLGEQKYDRRKCQCDNCKLIRSTWNKGLTDCAHLSVESSQYMCGYVTKKMTKKDDVRLNGKYPEFSRMSNRPGIGAFAMEQLSSFVTSEDGCNDLILTGDVPLALRHGLKKMPLGRYLRRKLREYTGFKETGAQPGWKEKVAADMQRLREAYEADPEYWNEDGTYKQGRFWKSQERKKELQKIRNLEMKHKICTKKGAL